jgi:hypothetical protein
MSSIVNKVKDVLHGDKHSAPEGTHGPHNSGLANAADPRVDSDWDNSRTVGGRTAGHGEIGSGTYNTGTTGAGLGGAREGEFGPHGSRMANAADPRVDSDLDGSRTVGNTGYSTGNTGFSGGNSGLNAGYAGSGATGFTGTHGDPAGTHGPHHSRISNVADPRVDSDRDGRGALHTGPGPAPNTAGPHSNDMMNKVDPRVDSDMDGSKTFGGNRTFQ